MSAQCTDYYCDENGNVINKYVYPSSESWTSREAEWVSNSGRVVYSVISTGMALKIYWDNNQYNFRKNVELPKDLQMKILIGAI